MLCNIYIIQHIYCAIYILFIDLHNLTKYKDNGTRNEIKETPGNNITGEK